MTSQDASQASTMKSRPLSIVSSYLNIPTPASKLSLRRKPANTSPSAPIQNHQLSHNELIDLRAAQRTFDMAYARTALGELAYSVVVLKLFQEEFYYVGLAYTVLSFSLILVSINRYALAVGNVERWTEMKVVEPSFPSASQSNTTSTAPQGESGSESAEFHGSESSRRIGASTQEPSISSAREDLLAVNRSTLSTSMQLEASSTLSNFKKNPNAPLGQHQEATSSQVQGVAEVPILMRTFKTAGNVVFFAFVGVTLLEVAILILVLKV